MPPPFGVPPPRSLPRSFQRAWLALDLGLTPLPSREAVAPSGLPSVVYRITSRRFVSRPSSLDSSPYGNLPRQFPPA